MIKAEEDEVNILKAEAKKKTEDIDVNIQVAVNLNNQDQILVVHQEKDIKKKDVEKEIGITKEVEEDTENVTLQAPHQTVETKNVKVKEKAVIKNEIQQIIMNKQ